MTGDQYLRAVVEREKVDTSIYSPVRQVQATLQPVIDGWAGRQFVSLEPSGSFAKGTAVKSGTDIDLFVSLSSTTDQTLKEIYDSLFERLSRAGFAPRRQNVSIGIRVGAYDVDVVPAKRQNAFSDDHSLYRQKADTWTKTNVTTHISQVSGSRRLEEIMIIKTWRNNKNLDFPSFYLELLTIQACSGKKIGAIANNVQATLAYIHDHILTASFIDPANTNNRVSDDLSWTEKQKLRAAAKQAYEARYWSDVVT